ncbi:MAG: FG-GAP-like repeat-containing protein [Planctomycetota bacterium]
MHRLTLTYNNMTIIIVGTLALLVSPRANAIEVTGTTPTLNTITAPTNSSITVTFDQPVNPASVTSNSFWAFGRWSGTAVGTFSFSGGGQSVTLTPNQPFFTGESVMVILSHDIQAVGGSFLRAAGYSFIFWTASQPSTLNFEELVTFSTRTTPFQSTRSYGGVGSDLNEDGYVDLAIVNEDTSDLRVYLNLADGSGLFGSMLAPPTPIQDQGSPNEPSDFNRDGHVDLAVCNAGVSTVSVLLGNGNGSFQPQQVIPVGVGNHGIAALDVDGDGDTDLVTTNSVSDNVSLLLNNGSGVFGAATSFEGGGSGEWTISAGDFDEDGILDIVIGAIYGEQLIVRRGLGNGTFALASVQSGVGGTWMLATGDVNGDGHVDVASANSFSNEGSISLGNGLGGFSGIAWYSVDPSAIASDLGDLDGDGDLDWVISSFSGDFTVLENIGGGVFAFYQEFPATNAASCAILMDIDNDGDMDIALVDELDDTVTLMQQDGPILPPTVELVRGDCNQDGGINLGDAIFELDVLFGPTPSTTCTDACDFNDDGGENIADPIFLLTYLFSLGAPPPLPSPLCGTDPTTDSLPCTIHTACP